MSVLFMTPPCEVPRSDWVLESQQLEKRCNELIRDMSSTEPGLRDAIERFIKMTSVISEKQSARASLGNYIK